MIIGLFVEVSTLFVPAELKFVGALVVLIIVLLIKPQGLLGKSQRVG
jgi:neutral amino acid transport system permease protein